MRPKYIIPSLWGAVIALNGFKLAFNFPNLWMYNLGFMILGLVILHLYLNRQVKQICYGSLLVSAILLLVFFTSQFLFSWRLYSETTLAWVLIFVITAISSLPMHWQVPLPNRLTNRHLVRLANSHLQSLPDEYGTWMEWYIFHGCPIVIAQRIGHVSFHEFLVDVIEKSPEDLFRDEAEVYALRHWLWQMYQEQF